MVRTAAWSDTTAWAFCPDVKAASAAAATARPAGSQSHVATVALPTTSSTPPPSRRSDTNDAAAPSASAATTPTPADETVSHRRCQAVLHAAVFTAIAKYGGGDAVVVTGTRGKLFPLVNPAGTIKRDASFADLVNVVADSVISGDSGGGAEVRTVAQISAAQHRTSPAPDEATKPRGKKQNTAAEQVVSAVAVIDRATFAAFTFENCAVDTCFETTFVVDVSSVEVICAGERFAQVHVVDRVELVASVCEAYEADPDATMAAMPSTTPSMRRRLLRDWQSPRVPVNTYRRTLVDLFADGVRLSKTTGAPAVHDVATGRSITYPALFTRARKIARFLHALMPDAQWGTNAACGIHLPRSGDWHTVCMGVLIAGGAYLSLDPTFPTDRLAYSLEDSEGVCFFTKRETADVLPTTDGRRRIIVDASFWQEIDGMELNEDEPVDSHARPNSPAYLLYTSGSTGKPKGVCVEHAMVVNHIVGFNDMLGPQSFQDLRVAQIATMSFDMSISEVWPPFATGWTVVTIEKDLLTDSELLTATLREEKITFIVATPTLLATLPEEAFDGVRMAITGGEACPEGIIASVSRRGCRLINGYGPTEATVCCAAMTLKPGAPVTIGRGLLGYATSIVGPSMELLPPGVPGELCIAGPSVSRGYVKRDDLTKEKFERCPFITEPVEAHHYDDETANDPTYHRLYHTGDLCRFNTDGCMEYLGRIDLQVKLRGYRIEIEEIESVLQTYPGVDLAIVAKREQNGVEFLCGYVQLATNAADRPTDQQLSQHLRQKIPAYMVPSRFMFVDEFARTPALKVDRKALPEPTIVAAPSAAAAAPDTKVSRVPATATEASVLEVYNMIFTDHARVGIALDSHFFDDLGGTSIMAGRALTELRRRNFNVSVRTLYTNPTIAGLAKHFDTVSATTAASASINIDGGKMEPPQPELPSAFRRPSTKRRVLIGVWQFVIGILAVSNMWLFLIPLQYLVQQLGLDLTMLEYGLPIFIGVLLAAVVVVVQLLYLALILPLLKWLIIQRRQPGRYWIYSWYAVRWWTVRALYDAFPAALYSHMNVVSWMYRATGASIGHGCLLPATFPEADLVTIGNDVYIAPSAQLLTAQVIDQQLILKPIRIGNGASIEACATLEGGSFVPPHCLVRPLAVVTEANELPEGCEWVPPGVSKGAAPSLPIPAAAAAAAAASKRDDETSLLVAPSAGTGGRLFRASFGSRFIAGLLQMAVFILTYTLITAAHFTVVYSMVRDGQVLLASPWYQGGLAVLVAFFGAAISAVWFAVVSAICARLIYPSGCREGTVAVTSPFEFHRWFMFQRVYLMAGTFYPIITTVFGPAWVRAIGLRVGENVQFGLVASLTPGLTDIGSDTFVADFATLNPPTVKGGLMTFRRQTIGDGTMIGNNSVVTCSAVGARCLVGAVTFAPENLPPGKMALGAPFFVSDRTAERPIERPSRTTLVLHALHNLADLVGGQWVSFLSICIGIAASGSAGPAGPFVGLFVFVFVMELLKTALLVFFKWCLNGRLRTANYSLQSPACWRYLSQFALMMSIVPFGILVVLRGSVLFPFVLRMIGMRVGSNCFVDTFQIPETDLAAVGDDSTLNANVTLGTHAAEDGVMKFGRVRIGRRVSIMSGTVIAPACAVGSGCSVAASSSVSKGERLDDMTHWAGMAVSRVPAPAMMNVLLERNTTGQHRVGGKAGYAAVEMRSVGAA